MNGAARPWARAGVIYLAASFLFVGLWATVDPRSFFDDFPGGGRRWVAGDGPYNAHLVGDAGVGFLAVGLVLLLAAVWMDRRVVQAACVAAIAHGGPHLLYHLRHPDDSLGSTDAWLSNGGLALGVAVAVAVLLASRTAAKGSGESVGQNHRRAKERTA